MSVLRFFEGIRTPVLDMFFSLITKFGEETFLIVIGLILFWCINKKHGYYVLSVGFTGLLINQFLKITFKVPRPWVKDNTFTIVESARAEATGYSFPSGHTQISVGAFGSIAKISKYLWLRVICIIICILVPLSRMYLGVHTPQDVLTSAVIAVLLIFAFAPVVKIVEDKLKMRGFLGILTALSVLYLLYVSFFVPASTDLNYISAVENAYKVAGCIIGLWCGYEIDIRFIKFETKAVWWAQLIKVVTGLIPLLMIKELLKEPLRLIFSSTNIGDCVRYLLIALFISGIWPATFKYFSKMGKTPKS